MARKSQAPRVRVVDDMGRPTPERLRHAQSDYEIADGRGGAGTITMRDCPLDRVKKRGQIGPKEYDAALKFRHHWWHGGMAGQVKSLDLNQVFARDLSCMGHMAKTEAQAFHRQKYREACEMLGFRPGYIVLAVVCEEIEFELAGRKLGFENDPQARAAAVTLLQDGLYRLANLWGI
jgi:hypothetical protein